MQYSQTGAIIRHILRERRSSQSSILAWERRSHTSQKIRKKVSKTDIND